MLCLLPMSDRDKDVEILALRHQITVLERQLGKKRVLFMPCDRALMAVLLHRLRRNLLCRLRLMVRPDTVLRWHRDLVARRHATVSKPKRPGRPRTLRSIRALVWCLAPIRSEDVRARSHRAHHPADPDPARHRAPNRSVSRPSREESRHGPRGRRAGSPADTSYPQPIPRQQQGLSAAMITKLTDQWKGEPRVRRTRYIHCGLCISVGGRYPRQYPPGRTQTLPAGDDRSPR